MNRYQNPEVYERLALEYSLGTMHGGARKRFENLMLQHPFIQVTVDEYDNKLAELVNYLPEEKPAAHVWKNIEASIEAQERQQNKETQQPSWWQSFGFKGFGVAAALVLAVSVFFFNINGSGPNAYAADLVGVNAEPMIEIVANKDDMELKAVPTKNFKVPEGMQAHFWCLPKNVLEPIMDMGLMPATGMQMQLTAKSWQGIVDAQMFGVSFEPIGSNNSSPVDKLIYKGRIQVVTRT